ncbi:MAG: SusC/RagA family TonB-linked outer membrane protein [Bacteroidota bacterium]
MKSIMKKYMVLCLLGWIFIQGVSAQESMVNGRIINSEGKSVSGAVASIEGTEILTVSDNDGFFSINGNSGDILLIKAGLLSESYSLKDDGADYILTGYRETVNWGLGNQQRVEHLTSAISTVYTDQLVNNSVINPENALYGQLAGLTVLQNGGAPWSRDPNMMIRGIGTTGNNKMLVLVDGFERPLESINLDAIESVSVLKDAAALAIYGMRGANGALVVTTKRGEYESFNVDVSYQHGINTPTRLPNMLDAYTYAEAVNEASAMDGNPFVYSEWDLQDYQNGTHPDFFPNVDWMDEVLKDYGTSSNFNAQFKGGGKSIRYFTNINYQEEEGFLNQTDLDPRYDSQIKYSRFNARTNIDVDITKTTLVSVNMGASMSNMKYPGAGISSIMNAMYNVPSAAFPVYSIGGIWGGTENYKNNPVALIAATGYKQDFTRELLGDITIKQDLGAILDGLSAEVSTAFDNSATFNEGKTKPFEYESIDIIRDEQTGMITDTISNLYGKEKDLNDVGGGLSQWRHGTIRAKMDYEKSFDKNFLTATVLFNQDQFVPDGHYNTYLRQNFAGNVHYAYDGKYLADMTLSYAGSSVLPSGEKFGLFPALSAAWILSREDFLSNNSSIDFLKVRSSWGLTGSDYMSSNLFDQQFTGGGTYYFGPNYPSASGIKPGRLATIGLSYEKSMKSNIGIDMVMFEKLNLTVDAFHEKRTDILINSEGIISSVIGIGTALQNDGEVNNTGFEADITWKDEIGNFNYYVGGIFSFSKNRIINNNEMYRPYDYMRRTGLPVGQMFGLEAIGFFADSADIANSPAQLFSNVRPGDIKYNDKNSDGVIDSYDEGPIGYSGDYPEIYYSAKLGFEYKGFGLDAVLQGITNQTLYVSTNSVYVPLRNKTNISDFSANRWVPQDMDNATLPRLSLEDNANNYRQNSIWLIDASYLKLRLLNIYYNLPETIVKGMKLSHAKVFIRGMNLFSIDHVKVFDPEQTGISYPTIASYHLGVNIGF